MQTTYSETFKIDAVKKVLSRVSKTPLSDVARSLDLPISTLCGWVKAMKNKDLREPLSGKGFVEKKSCQWTPQERFDAILGSNGLSKEQLPEYCRKLGIFPHHLEEWKKNFITNSSSQKSSEKKSELKAIKEENKQLSKELHRKDKALAEAAALLILKKKAEDYWTSKEAP
jgi:transposase-like protein